MPELTPFLYDPGDGVSAANFWLKKTGWDSLLSPAASCHPKSELWGDARHSLPSGSELATSSWKDLWLNDISLEWNTDHLSAVNDNIYLLTSQDQHCQVWNLCSPLKMNYTKLKIYCELLAYTTWSRISEVSVPLFWEYFQNLGDSTGTRNSLDHNSNVESFCWKSSTFNHQMLSVFLVSRIPCSSWLFARLPDPCSLQILHRSFTELLVLNSTWQFYSAKGSNE